MAATLGDLKTRILYETNKNGSDFDYGVTNAIVTAIKYMEMEHPWVFSKGATITILTGTNSVALPADFNQLLDAKYSIPNTATGITILYGAMQGFTSMTYPDLNAMIWSTGETGFPTRYAVWGNQFFVYPYTNTAVPITINYNYKDSFYPAVNNDESVWFNDQTIDVVRNKALEVFYRDTLQSPEIANSYVPIYQDYSAALSAKNNKRQVFNILSV